MFRKQPKWSQCFWNAINQVIGLNLSPFHWLGVARTLLSRGWQVRWKFAKMHVVYIQVFWTLPLKNDGYIKVEVQGNQFIMLKNGPWDLDWVQSIFGFLFVFFTWCDPDKSFKIIPRLCKWLPTHVLDKLHAGQRDHWEGGFISPDLWWFVFLCHRRSWHVTRIIHWSLLLTKNLMILHR